MVANGASVTKVVRKKASSETPEQDGTKRYNLYGQKLGKKGRETRDRIIVAAQRLLEQGDPAPFTLSAVAREASLGLTSLYLYFSDLTELLLAVLEPVTESAEEAYIAHLRVRWPDADLNACCLGFVHAYRDFWQKHSRLLHLRNSMADHRDERMLDNRIRTGQRVIEALYGQMRAVGSEERDEGSYAMATVLATGIERVVTMATDLTIPTDDRIGISAELHAMRFAAAARLLEMGIAERRRLQG